MTSAVLNEPTTTTTTETRVRLGSIRGYSLDVLKAINEGITLVPYIAQVIGKTTRYTHAYVANLTRYGLISRDSDGYLSLTLRGKAFSSLLLHLAKSKLKESTKEVQTKYKEGTKKGEEEKSDPWKLEPIPQKQLSITGWIARMNVDEAVAVVVDGFVKHYNETGGKYLFFKGNSKSPDWYEVGETFNLDTETAKRAFTELFEQQRFSKYADTSVGKWKIAIKPQFLQELEMIGR